ncbi:MAG TPA: ribbon-helix-helix domain-containing protein [Candidatus Lokiarchaeia archaeon]|nr:ribbon-helix-helix domain-containing protein [Candidatus Lokiarchaeia archaeon]
METLQIRLPKNILKKVDELVASGFYRSRSEILREALRDFIGHSSFNGSLPFIVGPFKDESYRIVPDKPLDAYQPAPESVEWVKDRIKNFKL